MLTQPKGTAKEKCPKTTDSIVVAPLFAYSDIKFVPLFSMNHRAQTLYVHIRTWRHTS